MFTNFTYKAAENSKLEPCRRGYADCTVIKSFGPFKVGDHIDIIDIDYEAGRVWTYIDSSYQVLEFSLNIELVPDSVLILNK